MGTRVIARQVRTKLLVPIFRSIENQTALFLVTFVAKCLRTKKNTELQRHVEPREIVSAEFGSGEVMDPLSAFRNNAVELPDSAFA